MGLFRMKRWKLSIFPKLFIAFVLVIAPLYGIGLVMNQLGQDKLEQELSQSLKSRVDFYLNSLENENLHTVNMLQEYIVDRDLQHLTYLSKVMSLNEWAETVIRIQNKLEHFKQSSLYVKSVEVYIVTLNRTISSEQSISDYISEDFEAVKNAQNRNGFNTFYWKERMFLALSYPPASTSIKQPGFVISIELNLNTLQLALKNLSSDNTSSALIYHKEHNMLLSENTDLALEDSMKAFMDEQHELKSFEGLQKRTIAKQQYLVAYKYSPTLNYYLLAYTPMKEMLGSLSVFRNLLWSLSVISLITILIYSFWIYRLIHKPLHYLVTAFRRVEHGQLEPMQIPRSDDEFRYLYQRFNMMMENLQVLIHQAYEQKIRAQSSELKQLQAQINPHFLYNTYFILYRLAKMNDNESIIKLSQYLGEYFQYITRNAVLEVPLEHELKHSRTYAEIQNIRFNDRIHVGFTDLPEDIKGLLVPRLILQPLIENAYKYGLEGKRRNGKIIVHIEVDQGMIKVSVEDNGDNLSDQSLNEIKTSLLLLGNQMEYTGLLNVHRRLQIRFGMDSGLSVSRSPTGGLKVIMSIPLPEAEAETEQPIMLSDMNKIKGE